MPNDAAMKSPANGARWRKGNNAEDAASCIIKTHTENIVTFQF
jgi:hypothetical protein